MSLPLVRLPSLDLIRGFVAVGRRMSITQAAQDLCLTQSAVSRQINALEAQLGLKLFHRAYRSIHFTPDGERLYRSANGALQQLQDVLAELSPHDHDQPVTLSASIGVAGLWLLPRLSRFQQRHPDIDLRISANNQVTNLRTEGVDLAIRYTTAALAPAGAVRLFGEAVAPVAHPNQSTQSLSNAKEVSRATLLEFDDPRYPWLHWADWFSAMGWHRAKPKAVLRFNQYDQVVHAALAGQGVALGRIGLIQPLLDERQLVTINTPHPPRVEQHAYWLVDASDRPRPPVRQVAQWIEAEATASRAGLARHMAGA